jgi:Lar family restriction alleviation protein
MVDKLLPCPFCGGEASMSSHSTHRHYVRCLECNQQFEQGTEQDALAAWNRREPSLSNTTDLSTLMGDRFDMRPSYARAWIDYLLQIGDHPPPADHTAALEAVKATTVRALEWFRPEGIHENVVLMRAATRFGMYEAWGGGGWNFNNGRQVTGGERSLDAAKAACQADYDTRTSLAPSPALEANQQEIETLREQVETMRAALEEVKFANFCGNMTIKDRADQSARLALAKLAAIAPTQPEPTGGQSDDAQ